MKRNVVEIDESSCDGCGLCLPSCAEGALKIIDGKAILVNDKICDGLGACLGHCPRDAIRIVERDASGFDGQAAPGHSTGPRVQMPVFSAHSCPGSRILSKQPEGATRNPERENSKLAHWPIQLHLVPVDAPFFVGADLLVSASCVPFAFAEFHWTLLAGKSLAFACPKLDRTEPYLEKLTEILRANDLRSLTVAVMEVSCCRGLVRMVRQALMDSGKDFTLKVVLIGINGTRK